MNPSRRSSGPRRQKGFRPDNPNEFQYGQFGPGPSPQLFNDTSGGFVPPYPPGANPGGWNQPPFTQPTFPGQQLLSDPMASMAMQYGQTIAGQGKVMVEEKGVRHIAESQAVLSYEIGDTTNLFMQLVYFFEQLRYSPSKELYFTLEKYVSISKMKYYFAVDTGYVTKKLGLLFFPFTHTDWAVHFNNQNEPVAPRYDVNAPDLYIPTMAFVTYLLTAGYILGSQNRFSPEQLGMQASSALGWSLVEICILFLALYVLSATSTLKMCDLIAFCSYKYVCMVAALMACIFFKTLGYYAVLGYSSLSLGFFLIRTLRVLILPKTTSDHYSSTGRHNSYLLLAICIAQPFLMYVLTRHLVTPQSINVIET